MNRDLHKRIGALLLALALGAAALPAPVFAADLLTGYVDLNPGAWYAPGVRYCLKNGLMTGYRGFGMRFDPDKPTTRAQFVTILWRYAKYRGGELPSITDPAYGRYGDRNEVSDYAAEAMEWACAMGIVAGMQDRRGDVWLMPWGNSSRAVVATMLMPFCMDFGIER